MKLRKIEVENFCGRIKDTVELEDGLIGVFGANGSGKTTMMSVAPFAALSNTYRTAGVKTDNIRQLSDENSSSHVTLHFEHGGRPAVVRRGLRRISSYFDAGEGRVTGENSITSAVETFLGKPVDILGLYVFVPQLGMLDWLRQPPEPRARALSCLFGTDRAETIHQALTKQLAADSSAAEIDLDLDSLYAQYKTANDRRKEYTAQLKSLEKGRPDPARLKEANLLCRRADRYHLAASSRDGAVAQVEALQPRVAEAKTALKVKQRELDAMDYQSRSDALRQTIATKESELKNARSINDRVDAYQEAARLAKFAQEELDKLGDPPASDEYQETEHSVSILTRQINELDAELSQLDDLLDVAFADDGAECSRCGQSLAPLLKDRSKSEARRKEVAAELKRLQAEKRNADTKRRKLIDAQHAHLNAELNVKSATQALIPMKGWAEEQAVDTKLVSRKLAEARAELAELSEGRQTVSLRLDVLRRELSKQEGLLQAAKTARDEAESRMEASDYEEAELEAAQLLIKESATYASRLETLTSLYEQHRDEIYEPAKKRYADAREAAARTAKARRWKKMLETQQSVFHWKSVPQTLGSLYLERITDQINKDLVYFGSPFEVSVRQAMDMAVAFPSGVQVAANRLSPGQGMVAGLCFRLAVMQIFAADLGCLNLDEPTEGLDEQNLLYLREALPGLRQLIRDRDLQLVMITHHQELAPVFDQIINVEAAREF